MRACRANLLAAASLENASCLDAAWFHDAAPVPGGEELPVEADAPHRLVRNRLDHQHIRH